jgi:ABC-2 type transport system permease protein
MFIPFGMPIAHKSCCSVLPLQNEINNVNIAISGQVQRHRNANINTNKISASKYFQYQQAGSESEIESIFKRKVKAVLVFENHFVKNLQTQNKPKYRSYRCDRSTYTITNYVMLFCKTAHK